MPLATKLLWDRGWAPQPLRRYRRDPARHEASLASGEIARAEFGADAWFGGREIVAIGLRPERSQRRNRVACRMTAGRRTGSSGTAVGHAYRWTVGAERFDRLPMCGAILGALSGSRANRYVDHSVDRRVVYVTPSARLPCFFVFDGPELRVVCEVVSNKAIEEARGLSDLEVLGGTVDELIEKIIAPHDMDTPVLEIDGKCVTEEGSGSSIELHVPFEGARGLFENQPNFYTSVWPDGAVSGQEIVKSLGAADAGANARAEEWRRLTEQHLTAVRHDLEIWRDQLRFQLRGLITRRRLEAESHQAGLAQLGIPIRRRADAPRTFTAPAIIRREAPTRASTHTPSAGDTEPALSDAYYDHRARLRC
jgi:hypothetical protein